MGESSRRLTERLKDRPAFLGALSTMSQGKVVPVAGGVLIMRQNEIIGEATLAKIDRRTVLTTQMYFDDNVTDEIYLVVPPYSERPPRDTRNETDSIYHDVGLVTAQRSADGCLAALNLGLNL